MIDMNIRQLVAYAIDRELIDPRDSRWAVNRLLEIRLYREMGLSIPMIQDILEGSEASRKQFLEQISKEIHSDIRKRIADAKIIDSLKRLTHEELNEVITEAAELERLRSRLLAMSGADPQNES